LIVLKTKIAVAKLSTRDGGPSSLPPVRYGYEQLYNTRMSSDHGGAAGLIK
jgi:hypothetical protein